MRLEVGGQPLHTRSLTLVVSAADAGRVQVRGDVIDLRKTSFVPMPEGLQTAGIIHHMIIDARVGPDRTLEALETAQPFVAVEPCAQTGGESCRDPASRLQALVDRRFDAGFASELSACFGGPRGCSHLLTLFHLLASALPAALDAEAALLRETGGSREAGERFFRRSVFVDGHQPADAQLDLAVLLSDFHSRPAELAAERLGHFASQHEVRVLASVDMSNVTLRALSAFERERTRETLASAEWQDVSERVDAFRGRPIMPGLGSALRAELAGEPERARLLDSLVQLAPGFVQCTPVLADRAISQMGQGGGGPGSGGKGRRSLPNFLSFGGATDSCYMWRAGGPLADVRNPGDRKG